MAQKFTQPHTHTQTTSSSFNSESLFNKIDFALLLLHTPTWNRETTKRPTTDARENNLHNKIKKVEDACWLVLTVCIEFPDDSFNKCGFWRHVASTNWHVEILFFIILSVASFKMMIEKASQSRSYDIYYRLYHM